jgi:hypothetical protein
MEAKGQESLTCWFALNGVMHHLAARKPPFEDGDGTIRSTYDTEFEFNMISVVFVLAGLNGNELLTGDGSIRIENTTKTGDASFILISAEEDC